ncbi:MAG: ABC transporter ATP-binding protein [Dorea sp.]|nr:ABC transporter ATP-binding protein [Dorea sp.]
MDILQTKDLTKYYGEEPLVVKALDGITLQIGQGSFTAIVGTSGSGKSTLLHMLGGLDTPTGGSVVVDGQSLGKMSRSELTIFRRRKIGFIFQNYNLISNLTIYDNIVLPIELDGRSVDRQYLDKIVSVLGLEGKLERKPNKLSGGQQQRAAIARALITKPALILADEPTGNLDSRTSQEVVGLLQATGKKFHQTIVMITHNDEIAQIADRTIRMEDGRIAKGEW